MCNFVDWGDKCLRLSHYYILEGMSEISESRMRNQALRKNIRRMELDNYFQERRKELLSQY